MNSNYKNVKRNARLAFFVFIAQILRSKGGSVLPQGFPRFSNAKVDEYLKSLLRPFGT
jgi:hypothetical protein